MSLKYKIVIVLAVVVLAVAGYVLSRKQASAPTGPEQSGNGQVESWQTYTNGALGFQIKHPLALAVEEDVVENDPQDSQAMDYYFALGKYNFTQTQKIAFSMYVYKTKYTSLQAWIGQPAAGSTVKDISLGGAQAKEISVCGSNPSLETIVLKGDRVYQFKLSGACGEGSGQSEAELYRNVVSTFKFTAQQ